MRFPVSQVYDQIIIYFEQTLPDIRNAEVCRLVNGVSISDFDFVATGIKKQVFRNACRDNTNNS